MNAEEQRIEDAANRTADWKRWGPYLSERQWGTVREDYSANGDAWDYFPHDQARSRAYRWGEDGLLGFCDRQCRMCFAIALWNGADPILKERLFGLTGPEGNHGEDVKEAYFYLDSTPTHSYCKALYKYPQRAFPYNRLVEENRRRSRLEPEFELSDTGIFHESRYFDVFVEYAKGAPNDILIRITAINRGPERAILHLLPTFWYRNTWSWGCTHQGCEVKPRIALAENGWLSAEQTSLGRFRIAADPPEVGATVRWLFTDNDTNSQRLFNSPSISPHVKDAFDDYVIHGRTDAVNPNSQGTKAAAYYERTLEPSEAWTVRLRLSADDGGAWHPLSTEFAETFAERHREADEFYHLGIRFDPADPQYQVVRQACAGVMWTKQFYHYVVRDWLDGDPDEVTPPAERKSGRNSDWDHLYARDVVSMPDKWEYPWFAAWDLAFHMILFAKLDPDFAKRQLLLLLREWYMHPNGQMPAYEFGFSDVNPPVHAWACWRVYKMSAPRGERDRVFLARAFQKLLINFTWWVNRKDVRGRHLFSGGFLGLDNIGVFDRSRPLPTGGYLEQADGTAWMAFYCATMLSIALELARYDTTYEDIASKFFEHFVAITDAINTLGGTGLWDEQDGFYYDQLHAPGESIPLRIRSMVGLIPLFAVEILEEDVIQRLSGFRHRMEWFLEHRKDLARHIAQTQVHRDDDTTYTQRLLAIVPRDRLQRVLGYLLNESEFLSPFGIRSLSRIHLEHPFIFKTGDVEHRVQYAPAESDSSQFGGNSNWRGPIWFPVNFLLIEALERYHHFYGDECRVECPVGSGTMLSLREVAREITRRLAGIFRPDSTGNRPCHGGEHCFGADPHWRDLVLFYEYFDGDTGRGVGANHQTGWTALVAHVVQDLARRRLEEEGKLHAG